MLASCPMDYVTDDVWALLQYAELYAKGVPPIAGGALDQAHAFNLAARFVWNEQRRVENELAARWRPT